MKKAIEATAKANRDKFVEDMCDYGMLLNSMTSAEFALEIGKQFPNPSQAAIITTLAAKVIALETVLERHFGAKLEDMPDE